MEAGSTVHPGDIQDDIDHMWDESSDEGPREEPHKNAQELRRLAGKVFATHNQDLIKEIKARRDAESDDEGERERNRTEWERKKRKDLGSLAEEQADACPGIHTRQRDF
jgi:hypothetical protein